MTCRIGLFHVVPAWLLFVLLYITGYETIDWSNIPLLSLTVTSLSVVGTSNNLLVPELFHDLPSKYRCPIFGDARQ